MFILSVDRANSQQAHVKIVPKKPEPAPAPDLVHDFPSLVVASKPEQRPPPTSGIKSSPVSKQTLADVGQISTVTSEEQHNMGRDCNNSIQHEKSDLAKSPSLLVALGAKQRTEEEVMQMGTFLKDPDLVKKGLHKLGQRTKRFSTLKKKVLQERLEQWNEHNAKKLSTTETKEITCSETVGLWNFCTPEQAQDEDELEEIVTNLREMSARVGDIHDLYVDNERGHAFFRFATPHLAKAAQACWDGLVVGGDRLDAELIRWESADETWRAAMQNYQRPIEHEGDDTTFVILENILTQDDLEDTECLQESLNDVRAMACDLGKLIDLQLVNTDQVLLTYHGSQTALRYFDGKVISGQVVSARVKGRTVTSVQLLNVLTKDDLDDDDCLEESLSDLRQLASQYGLVKELRVMKDQGGVVVVEYEGNDAQTAAASLNGRIIGGNVVEARVLRPTTSEIHTITLLNLLTQLDLEDRESLDETKADVAELAGRFARVVRVEVDAESISVRVTFKAEIGVVEDALKHFNSMVIGGQKISAILTTNDEFSKNPIAGFASEKLTLKEDKASIAPLYSGDKLVSERFAEMKRVPKIPSDGVARKYATLVNDETVKPILIEMLNELARLQKRAQAEKNLKAKRRLVMGLREVARGIRSRKVRIVVMANNLDNYGAIDEKLQEIVDLAREESVPIFYELNKRGLGKAIGKNIKIGVVGVQNADGANQQFKALLSIANLHGLY